MKKIEILYKGDIVEYCKGKYTYLPKKLLTGIRNVYIF